MYNFSVLINIAELFDLSEKNRRASMRVVADSRFAEIWESVIATVNMVGKVKSGLMYEEQGR